MPKFISKKKFIKYNLQQINGYTLPQKHDDEVRYLQQSAELLRIWKL